MSIQDWGVTYDELEPYYDRFEYMAGISGKRATSGARTSRAATRSKDPVT
jgi:choline dehydrogenase-like flavoprotein